MKRRAVLWGLLPHALTLSFMSLPQRTLAEETTAIPPSVAFKGQKPKPFRPIYLTMDDGYEHVDTVIKETRELGIPVTFFPTGQALREHPDSWRALYADGHEFGCHTYSHPFASKLSVPEFRAELLKCKNTLAVVLGPEAAKNIKYFRFPYGDSGGHKRTQFRHIVTDEFGWHIIGWDLSLSDVFSPGTAHKHSSKELAQQFTYRVGQNDVVLMHFVAPDYKSLEELQSAALKLRYRFARLDEHPKIDKAGVIGQ